MNQSKYEKKKDLKPNETINRHGMVPSTRPYLYRTSRAQNQKEGLNLSK